MSNSFGPRFKIKNLKPFYLTAKHAKIAKIKNKKNNILKSFFRVFRVFRGSLQDFCIPAILPVFMGAFSNCDG